MPTTLVRRFTSLLSRSSGLVTGMKGGGCRLRLRIGCWWSPAS
jgi:hypothetical protein